MLSVLREVFVQGSRRINGQQFNPIGDQFRVAVIAGGLVGLSASLFSLTFVGAHDPVPWSKIGQFSLLAGSISGTTMGFGLLAAGLLAYKYTGSSSLVEFVESELYGYFESESRLVRVPAFGAFLGGFFGYPFFSLALGICIAGGASPLPAVKFGLFMGGVGACIGASLAFFTPKR
jgi:hypothetical protein